MSAEQKINRMSGPDYASAAKSRKAGRRLSQDHARLTHNGEAHEIQLINVSGGGAMIASSLQLQHLDTVQLHLGSNGTVECVVRWVGEGRAGLEFAQETQLECTAEERAQLLRGASSHAPAAEDENASANISKTDDGRRAKRHPLIWSGVLLVGDRSTPVRVRNISATGAMVQSSSPVGKGAAAVLDLGKGIWISAMIGWKVGDQVGLSFDSEFDMSQLGRSAPKVAPTHWVRPAYLDQIDDSGSSAQTRWDRMSAADLQELEGFLKR